MGGIVTDHVPKEKCWCPGYVSPRVNLAFADSRSNIRYCDTSWIRVPRESLGSQIEASCGVQVTRGDKKMFLGFKPPRSDGDIYGWTLEEEYAVSGLYIMRVLPPAKPSTRGLPEAHLIKLS